MERLFLIAVEDRGQSCVLMYEKNNLVDNVSGELITLLISGF